MGFRQRLWSVTDTGVLDQVVQIMKTKLLFIADGHHRYETALNYRRARRQQAGAPSTPQPYDNVLMLFASLEDKGLTVLPTHRVLTTPVPAAPELLRRLEPMFDVTPLPFQSMQRTAGARDSSSKPCAAAGSPCRCSASR